MIKAEITINAVIHVHSPQLDARLDSIERKVDQVITMANDLSAELQALNDSVAALGPAIDHEIQQVIDAINAGAEGAAAIAALEAARGNIGTVTAMLNDAVSRLGADDAPPAP